MLFTLSSMRSEVLEKTICRTVPEVFAKTHKCKNFKKIFKRKLVLEVATEKSNKTFATSNDIFRAQIGNIFKSLHQILKQCLFYGPFYTRL